MSRELRISEDYLGELINYTGKSLVGKMLKRFELFDDKEVIKQDAKELIYEQFRHFRDLLVAHSAGLDIVQFELKPSQHPNKKG